MSRVILLVDDNDADSSLVQMALQERRSETHLEIVRDGEQAVFYLHKQGDYFNAQKPNLVILDWNLPRKNGQEVLAEMRKEPSLHDVPVIIFTGGRFAPEMSLACEQKFVFCLIKPTDLDSFFDAVGAMDEYVTKTAKRPSSRTSHLEALKRLIQDAA